VFLVVATPVFLSQSGQKMHHTRSWTPADVKPTDILKALCITYSQNYLHIKYHEHKKEVSISIPFSKSNTIQNIQYIQQQATVRHLNYPGFYLISTNTTENVKVPKIGRESYDLMGTTGSPHAGELIGFGCSVFHSTLQFVQLMIACLVNESRLEETLNHAREEFFKVDPDLHHRTHLAKFQTKQIIEAVLHGKEYTYYDYLKEQDILEIHAQDYVKSIENGETPTLSFFLKRLEQLQTNYPQLYPTEQEQKEQMNPRYSFYDGSNVEINESYPISIPKIPFTGMGF
jgi:hypothetical protein